jgi:lipopolysaccharide/colanic/teichoic acid biosynthesis glycosyltransferase
MKKMHKVLLRPRRGWREFLKRAADALFAAIGLAVLCPLLGAVALLIRATMGGPVLFRQVRPGKYKRPFTLLKFRTMSDTRDSRGRPLSDGERLTKMGAFLRACSLDELPQLWNVLRGDMSLVGPRPLLMQYLGRYTPEQSRRHEVLPGITGWAQINGRNALSWQEKFALDTWYVDHWSLGLDVRILTLTAWRVLRREGISSLGHTTMPEFMGVEASEQDCSSDGTQYRKTGIGE